MLINVCACKWSRVHPRCLESLQKTTPTCGVCKEPFTHSTEMRSLTALLWEQCVVPPSKDSLLLLLLRLGLLLTRTAPDRVSRPQETLRILRPGLWRRALPSDGLLRL